jgi:hypothetical protein
MGVQKNFTIWEFPKDDVWWQLQGFGVLRVNPNAPSQLNIRTLLVPVDPLRGKIDENIAAPRKEWVGVGMLPGLTIGTRWHNRRLTGHARNEIRSIRVSFSDSAVELLEMGARDSCGNYLIPRSAHPMPDREFLAGRMLRLKPRGWRNPLLLSCVEVFRAFYARESRFAVRFLRGPLPLIKDRLFMGNDSGMRNDICQIRLRKGLGKASVRPISWIACTECGKDRAQEILHSASKRFNSREPEVIDALPPFKESVEMKVAGVAIHGQGFFVHRILETEFPAPCGVALDMELWKRDREEEPAEDVVRRGKPKPTEPEQDDEVVQSMEEPEAYVPQTLLRDLLPKCTNAIEVDTAPRRASGHESHFSLGRPEGSSGDLSTAEETHGVTGTRPAILRRVERRGLPGSLGLALDYTRLTCEIVGADLSLRDLGTGTGLAEFRPCDPDGAPIPWAFLRRLESIPRRVLIAEILSGKACYYLAEIERRPTNRGERFKLLLFSNSQSEALSDETIGDLLDVCAYNKGRWPTAAQFPDLKMQTMKHTKANAQAYAKAICERLKGWRS